MAALFSLVGRGIFPVIRKEYECIIDTESYFVVFSYANKICLNTNLQKAFFLPGGATKYSSTMFLES